MRQILPITEELFVALDQRPEFCVLLATHELHCEAQGSYRRAYGIGRALARFLLGHQVPRRLIEGWVAMFRAVSPAQLRAAVAAGYQPLAQRYAGNAAGLQSEGRLSLQLRKVGAIRGCGPVVTFWWRRKADEAQPFRSCPAEKRVRVKVESISAFAACHAAARPTDMLANQVALV